MPDKDMGKSENLRKMFEQYWLHSRHLENERLWFTNIYAVVWAASLGFMSQQGRSIELTIFLLFLSYLGMLLCHSLRLPFIRHTRLAEIILRKEWQLKKYSFWYQRDDEGNQETYQSGEVKKPIAVNTVFYAVYTVGILASSIMIFQQIPWWWARILFIISSLGITAFLWWRFNKSEDSLHKEIGRLADKETIDDYTANLSPENVKVALRILEVDPSKVDIVVQVQEELNNDPGILRDGSDNQKDDRKIRNSTITYNDHISRFEDNDPQGRRVQAFVGNGNLLMNTNFVAWIKGELFHVKNEPIFSGEKPYSSLVVWKNKRVTVEELWFRQDSVRLDIPEGKEISNEILYTTYGQRLIDNGQFVSPFDIRDQYYDIRHLILFPFFEEEKDYFGLNQLESSTSKREQALKKLPVELELTDSHEEMQEALAKKQYQEVKHPDKVKKEGQYNISNNKIKIIFRSGLYPHNIICTTEDDRILSILVSGFSNTAGLILEKADRLFEDIGDRFGIKVRDAILLDNGGDVMMNYKQRMVVKSFMSPPRDRLRSVILFVAPPNIEGSIRLI